MGAWLALVGGGLGFAFYINRSNGSDAATETGDSTDETIMDNVSGVGGSGQWVDLTTPTTSTTASITTNEEWGVAAINHLIAAGYDGAVSDSAIRKYLAGASLSTTELALVRIALNKLGATPVPLSEPMYTPTPIPGVINQSPGSTTTVTNGRAVPALKTLINSATTGLNSGTKPVSTTTPTFSTAAKKYTIAKGDSLSSIAAKQLGNSTRWREIYNLNKSAIGSNPNKIKVGTVLTLP